ncbi:peptidoglycan D,D-transpeptidase FtsI family protein [Neobacillus terrae]|uniref:peptidoglycan D,D-transpeptidase FtsI family protein n=1 Tax=Neobacillus terrae TaxID=3034837 RepID=UPI001409BDD8|nr:penicillin-binding transpeptidase domain-containing protein [Neobacillus terrae]NHM30409.1 penicillin-binding protein 2 [Neobacillus terrae]
MWQKRANGFLIFYLIIFSLLLIRLMQVQLFETETFTSRNINLLEESVKQRAQELVIDNGRGEFLDRNGRLMTEKKTNVLVLFPFLKKIAWDVKSVSSITGISKNNLMYAINKAKKPFSYGDPLPISLSSTQMKKINELKIPGVFAVERKFPIKNIPAEQLIGLAAENPSEIKKRYPNKSLSSQTPIGISGLEESFDEFLLPEGKSSLIYHVDGDGAPLFGLNVRYTDPANPFYPVNIKTTVDKDIQEKAEELASVYGIKKGGLVLLDIQDNSVLAMVSRPSINKKNPYSGGGMSNMMLKQQIMGSVFKTVVAAAAIDYNLDSPARSFDCSKKINGKQDEQHQYGNLDFSTSFAVSCNRAFGQLAVELKNINPKILDDYAERLSLTGPVGWEGDVYHTSHFRQMKEEEKGRVFRSDQDRLDANFVAMSGIGQHEVRATPLGVASMMATIARGGDKKMIKAVSAIEYKNHSQLIQFPDKAIAGDTIAPYTAMELQKLLRRVITDERGTGRWFQNLPYEVAGKSGTAETGRFVDGNQLHNKWFAGYFPYQNPRYALVVVNLDVYENEGGINPLFADMVKWLYENKSSQ